MESGETVTRPSLAQLAALISFIQEHPILAQRKNRPRLSDHNFHRLWTELADTVNSINGAYKTKSGWVKLWADRRRSAILKQKHIQSGSQSKLTIMDQKILDLINMPKKKKGIKEEPCNEDENNEEVNSFEVTLLNDDDVDFKDNVSVNQNNYDQQLNIMEKLVDVMAQQATAMAQVAQAQMDHSKSLERLAESSHIQALAVEKLAGSCENIISSVHDVRNALLGIDYSMKRMYPPNAPQRQMPNLFN